MPPKSQIMNIRISSYNNYCTVKGVLDKSNVKVFLSELYHLITQVDSLTLSLEGLESIDRHGVQALAQLHNEFVRQQKQFSVVGNRTDMVYAHFKANTAA